MSAPGRVLACAGTWLACSGTPRRGWSRQTAGPCRRGRRHLRGPRHLGATAPRSTGTLVCSTTRAPTGTPALTASRSRSTGACQPLVERPGATGVQHLPFTTLYQLVAESGGPLLASASKLLLLDLLGYWLSGQRGAGPPTPRPPALPTSHAAAGPTTSSTSPAPVVPSCRTYTTPDPSSARCRRAVLRRTGGLFTRHPEGFESEDC